MAGGRAWLDGAPLACDAPLLDVAFAPDGDPIAIDVRMQRCRWDARGACTQHEEPGGGPGMVVSLAREAVLLGNHVRGPGGELRWTFRPDEYDVNAHSRISATLVETKLALAHATLQREPRPPGRGFLVIDLTATPRVETVRRGRDILDRHWLQTRAEPGPTLFAFDAAGTRMIHASPERTPHVGAIRVGKGGPYVATHPGGAHAIALDPCGIIAAYAYPAERRRFRIDYLDPEDGGTMIEVQDSLMIDPSLPDIAAMAFSPDSHAIACCASDGTIEIVPVP